MTEVENNADKRTNHQVPNYSLSPILKIFRMAHSLSGSENLQWEHEPHSRRRPAPPEVCSLAGRLLWLTRRPQVTASTKEYEDSVHSESSRIYRAAFSTITSSLYIKHILQMHHDQQRTARAALEYPKSEYD